MDKTAGRSNFGAEEKGHLSSSVRAQEDERRQQPEFKTTFLNDPSIGELNGKGG